MKILKQLLFCLSLLMASSNVWANLSPAPPIEPATQSTKTKAQKLTKQERQTLRKELKETKKQLKQSPNQTKADKVLCIILAILLPPVGVLVFDGGVTLNFWIDLLLCLLVWLPGIIFALLVVLGVVNLAK